LKSNVFSVFSERQRTSFTTGPGGSGSNAVMLGFACVKTSDGAKHAKLLPGP
jgi:hypothetical protein